ncbi:MAG: hypothetical protein US49_C0003G0100 [candidate division TM6 bacterium GW2011_GWF2_37_49]|nr:MAG: hypothetical protein US49_C0003G0100 [candidate division TM6 bacterium GW2011_GWF2_37_49]
MKLKLSLYFVILSTFYGLSAVDLPVFYRAPYFQNTFGKNEAKYTTQFSVRYMHGETRNSWNDHNDKKSLFSSYGYTNLATMGLNIENPNAQIQQFWVAEDAPFNPDKYTQSGKDGLIDFKGKFDLDEVDFTIQQDIFWGFFAQVYVPVRDIKFKNISYNNLGEATIGQTGHQVNVDTFMKDTLNPILESMGLKDYQKPYSDSGVSEILASIGWHKYARVISPIIKSLSGTVQAGVLLPTDGKMPDNISFAMPIGYGQYWAANLRANAFVGIFDWLGLGAQIGTTIFFSERRTRRMKTDLNQSGWILLEKAFCTYNPGQEWDFGAHVQVGPFFGLSFMAGYSYSRQEKAELTVRDHNFLKTYSQNLLNQDPWDPHYPSNTFPMVASKNEIVNTDNRLRPWDTHTLHLVAKYEFESEKFCPSIQFEYNYPFYSDYGWPTDVWGGSANLMLKFKF